MYLCRLQTLRERQRRQNRGQALCHHRLARTRRTYHDKVVAACRRHFQRTLHALLTAHVGEVEVEAALLFVELAACVDERRLVHLTPREQLYHVHDVLHAIHLQIVHHCRLTLVLLRHNQSLELLGSCPDGYRQRSLHGLQRAVEAQLAHEHIVGEHVARHGSACGEYSHSQRQVERASFLAQVGWSEVDGDVCVRKLISVHLQRRRYAVASFAHSGVAESGHAIHHAGHDIHFNGYGGYVEAVNGCGISLYEHSSIWVLTG